MTGELDIEEQVRARSTYFIMNTHGQIKIGSSDNIRKRISALQTFNPEPLIFVGKIDGNHERALHQRFSRSRITGEWFILTVEIYEFMKQSLPSGSISKMPKNVRVIFDPTVSLQVIPQVDQPASQVSEEPRVLQEKRKEAAPHTTAPVIIKDTMTAREAASILMVSVKTLQRWDREGKLISQRTRTNRRWYTREQVEKFKHGEKIYRPCARPTETPV